jgi:tetratricopeptide (TPR) repeat protein
MTPKRFFAADGSPLAHTRLDARAGVPHPRGCYTAAAGDEPVDLIPGAAFAHIKALGEEGERLMLAGDFRGAFDRFAAALDLLPDPRERWNAAGWLLLALGENAIRAGNFAAAETPLADAFWCPGLTGNPWAHLRRGQVALERGDPHRAADELARAYVGGGRAVFDGQDPKYFALVEDVLRPPPGADRLP